MSDKTLFMPDHVYDYLLDISLREPAILQELRNETAKLPQGHMQIAPEQGQLIAFLMEILKPKKILEIGTFTGYSALVMALAAPQQAKVITCDIDPNNTKIAEKYWQKAQQNDKIELRLGAAVDTLDRMISDGEQETFDVGFIDADKENYERYYEQMLILLRQEGVLMIDNTLWSGRVADPKIKDRSTECIRALNRRIREDDRVSLTVIPIGDGFTLVRKK